MRDFELEIPHLHPWQKEVFDGVVDAEHSGKRFVVKAKRQVGKSFLACILLIIYALKSKSTSICVEPTLNQSRRVFKQIVDMLSDSPLITNANGSLLTLELITGSELIFKSAEQKESLRGMTCTGLMIIDEGAFIPDDIYEILFPCCDAHMAPLLVISTPLFASGQFYKLYNSGLTTSFDWSKHDTSIFLPADRLEEYRQQLSPNKFRSEYLGEFITDGSNCFGDVKSAVQKSYTTDSPLYVGIDWGSGQGQDSTVVTWMTEKKELAQIRTYTNETPTEQIQKITEEFKIKPPQKVLVESNSIGSVYFDLLKKSNPKLNIQKFNTTNDSKRRIIETLASHFNNKQIRLLYDKELLTQLQHYQMEKTKTGYTYNAPSGYHDDYVMSLAIALECINKKGSYCMTFK